MSWLWIILPVLNAIAGLIAFEWGWKRTWRYRHPIKELDEKFPAYRRTDAVKWVKGSFYFGAMTIMIPRILFIFLATLLLTIMVKVLLLGQPRDG